MRLTLDPETQQFIDDKVRGGQYTRPEDVIRAGLSALRQSESSGDFAPGELDVLLAEGEELGRRHPACSIAEMREHIASRSVGKRPDALA